MATARNVTEVWNHFHKSAGDNEGATRKHCDTLSSLLQEILQTFTDTSNDIMTLIIK